MERYVHRWIITERQGVSEDNGELTGRTAVEIWMRLGKSMFPISGKNPFDTFETAEKSEGMIGVNAALPLELISIERRETKKQPTAQDRQNFQRGKRHIMMR